MDIAVGVVLAEHVQSLLGTIFGNQPTRGFRDPPDECDLDDRGESLDEGRDSPRPVIIDVLGAE